MVDGAHVISLNAAAFHTHDDLRAPALSTSWKNFRPSMPRPRPFSCLGRAALPRATRPTIGTGICPAWRGRARRRCLWRAVDLKGEAGLEGVLESFLDERNGEVCDVYANHFRLVIAQRERLCRNRRLDNSPAIYGWNTANHEFKVPSGTADRFLSSLAALGIFPNREPAINGWAIFKDQAMTLGKSMSARNSSLFCHVQAGSCSLAMILISPCHPCPSAVLIISFARSSRSRRSWRIRSESVGLHSAEL